MRRLYWVLLFALLICWGSNYTVVKIGLTYSSPLVFSTLRALLGAVGTIPLLVYTYKSAEGKLTVPKSGKALGATAIFGILFCGLFFGLWFTAETTIDPSTVSVIIYTNPLFVVLFSTIFLSEKISKTRATGMILGFIGAFVVLTKGTWAQASADELDFALLFVASISYAGSMIVYKKWLSSYNYYFVNFLQLLIGSAFLFFWTAFTGFAGFLAPTLVNLSFILSLLYLVVFGTIIANVIWLLLLDKRGPAWFASWTFLVPVFALVIALAVLGVSIVPVQIAGVALVVFGIYITNRQKKEEEVISQQKYELQEK
jgi:probable blue pigment (indigoidine) exporter